MGCTDRREEGHRSSGPSAAHHREPGRQMAVLQVRLLAQQAFPTIATRLHLLSPRSGQVQAPEVLAAHKILIAASVALGRVQIGAG